MKYIYAALAAIAINFQNPAAYGFALLWSVLALFEQIVESTNSLIKAAKERK